MCYNSYRAILISQSCQQNRKYITRIKHGRQKGSIKNSCYITSKAMYDRDTVMKDILIGKEMRNLNEYVQLGILIK